MLQISNATKFADQHEDAETTTTMLRPQKEVPWMEETMVLKVYTSFLLPYSPPAPSHVVHKLKVLITNEDNHLVNTANIPVNKTASLRESMLKGEVSLCGLRIAVQHHIGLQMCYATLL